MNDAVPVVFIVDDDSSVRTALQRLLKSVGWHCETFASARDFLNSALPDAPTCLVLDVRMPEMSGLDLQRELARRKVDIPIIFLTSHGDVPMSVRAMKAGAQEFLTKPFHDQDLLEAVNHAIARDRSLRAERVQTAELRAHFEALTPREREVMSWVVTGAPNKQIAASLQIAEKTVKVHRGQVMQKMGALSLADLVRMADRLRLPPPEA
jgi:FixJ family two-component response regulator